jgi:hypothetical protein
MAKKPRRKKEPPRFVETTYMGMTVREQKMLRAMQHYVDRNHEFHPNQCEGCLEFAAFLTVPGYEGADHPLLPT